MPTDDLSEVYLDLLKSALCASLYDESAWQLVDGPRNQEEAARHLFGKMTAAPKRAILRVLHAKNLALVRMFDFDPASRAAGQDVPLFGYTLTGRKRLDMLHNCVDKILSAGIPGDFIETGVWRGGSTILMRAVLRTRGVNDRIVWCADSFEGLPPTTDTDERITRLSKFLTVSLEQVQNNFARFGLLDDQVRFLKGWFSDTLPRAPLTQIALLRLDGDLYESTRDALIHLYDKVSPGGFVIVDDYNTWRGCRDAVDEFREQRGISAGLEKINSSAVYWKVSH